MEKQMTLSEFLDHAAQETAAIAKACASDSAPGESDKERMKALAKAWELAKQAFMEGQPKPSVPVQIFTDPAQATATETEIAPASAAASAEAGSASGTITRKADSDPPAQAWPDDMNTVEFMGAKGTLRKGDWGFDAEKP